MRSELLPIAYAGRRFTTYKRKALGGVKAFYFPVPTALFPSRAILLRIWHFANSRVSSLEDVAHQLIMLPWTLMDGDALVVFLRR